MDSGPDGHPVVATDAGSWRQTVLGAASAWGFCLRSGFAGAVAQIDCPPAWQRRHGGLLWWWPTAQRGCFADVAIRAGTSLCSRVIPEAVVLLLFQLGGKAGKGRDLLTHLQQQRSHAGWCRLPTLRVDEQDECVVIAKLSMLI